MVVKSKTEDGQVIVWNETQQHWHYEDTGATYEGPLVPAWRFNPSAARNIPCGNVGFIAMLMDGSITPENVETMLVDLGMANQVNSAVCCIRSFYKALVDQKILTVPKGCEGCFRC